LTPLGSEHRWSIHCGKGWWVGRDVRTTMSSRHRSFPKHYA